MRIIYHPYNNTHIYLPNFIDEKLPHVVETGHSYPVSGYKSDKLFRKSYVIHYVIRGKGKYHGEPIEGPCAFLETPNNVHYYTVADGTQFPQWEQYWIMFSGSNTEKWLEKAKIPNAPGVFPCPYIAEAVEIFKKIQNENNYTNQSDYFYMLAGLFELFSLHRKSKNMHRKETDSDRYVHTLITYIGENYAQIKLERELAEVIHVSTRYMHKLFRQKLGISPMAYLVNYRINQAKNLLITTNYSIKDVSEIVGFSTPTYFCRTFEKHCHGLSPSAYRKMKSKQP